MDDYYSFAFGVARRVQLVIAKYAFTKRFLDLSRLVRHVRFF